MCSDCGGRKIQSTSHAECTVQKKPKNPQGAPDATHFGRSVPVLLARSANRQQTRSSTFVDIGHYRAIATRTLTMAQHAVRTQEWDRHRLKTNILLARRDARPPHPPQSEARRPEHPHYITRKRSHRAHFRPHIQILFSKPKQRPSSFLSRYRTRWPHERK
jgi:hypothetical protein